MAVKFTADFMLLAKLNGKCMCRCLMSFISIGIYLAFTQRECLMCVSVGVWAVMVIGIYLGFVQSECLMCVSVGVWAVMVIGSG